jgi:27-O-demethylrifamycin SV methyltransferase
MSRVAADRPDTHYDSISAAWRLLMGESFHYGYFENPEDSLDTATKALTKQMALRAEIEPHHRVVDVGCGIGGPALYLVEHIGCHVSGLSTSPVGIATAKERAVERGFEERADFSVRDAMDNRFDDLSFDRVWVMESSHLMPDKSRMIHESARVLKPGGRLVLCDIMRIPVVGRHRRSHSPPVESPITGSGLLGAPSSVSFAGGAAVPALHSIQGGAA